MKNRGFYYLSAFLAALYLWNLLIASVWAADSITPNSVEKAVDDIMSTQLEKLHTPGAAVVVTQEDHILFSKGYGYADLERKVAFDPAKTIVRVGSLTKSFSASAAMQLVEQNKLDLNEDVNRYLHSYKASQYQNHPFNLHQLLTHTAGLDEAIYDINSSTRAGVLPTEQYLSTYFQKQSPIRKPGIRYEYSNVAFGLIGNIVEQVSGQGLNDYLSTHLFRPMNMPSATLELPLNNPALAQSYQWKREAYLKQPFSYINLPGAGALNVTPNEFSHYLITHLNQGKYKGKAVLQPQTVKAMHAQQFAADARLDGIGYGFFRGQLETGVHMLWATGKIDGFISKMVLVPSQKIGIFVISNSADTDTLLHGKVINAIAQILPAEPQAASQSPVRSVKEIKLLPEIEGVYQLNLNPIHGWGKWLRMLGSVKYTVRIQDDHTLIVKGKFPDQNEASDKVFQAAGDGLFVEKGGQLKILLYQENSTWMMIAPDSETMKQTTFWHRTWTLLVSYAASSIFFITTLLIWMIRYVLRAIRKTNNHISSNLAYIALLNTIFLGVQVVYANNQMVYGYSAWFIWGICTLPLLSALIAVWVLIVNGAKLITGEKRTRAAGKIVFAVLTLLHTAYLYYWNFLPFHYS
ncbi:beta-lactamase family protein [Paenibacillus sp. AK121]|uniref:serine hydrolase domain-containing protein n=1 Tax=Paenibacillus TaxID=44249 RepID=UPI001C217FDF|nr:serine hydrolase domain-containing protein [Paenibacillus sp. AK121]MBU9709581.1 beta-lactamase family protein [Paenibacillus sp. AK121]MEE4570348.1 serine hydrolase domain-containing protein [Paenibacillus polymyxa]